MVAALRIFAKGKAGDFPRIRTKRARLQDELEPGKDLATTYSRRTYRPTTIGAVAFHFRVRNGTGWFHHALVTRGQCWGRLAGFTGLAIPRLGLWGLRVCIDGFFRAVRPLSGIHMEVFSDLAGTCICTSSVFTVLSCLLPIPKTGIKPNG